MAELKDTTVSGTGAINLPSGTTAQRPIKTDIYTSTGNTTWTVPAGVTAVEVLIVGGGGGSGGGGNTGYHGGGGGGGGVVYHPNFAVTPGANITITVGGGGSAGAQSGDSGFRGTNGGNSAFGTLIANGGGGGGGNSASGGLAGGSGGGGNLYSGAGGASNQPTYTGATVYGNSGGSGQSDYGSGGGGGGAGSTGGNGSSNIGGRGGHGVAFNITGTYVFYGAGGAAAGNSRHGEAVRGATPAYTSPNNGTGAGGGGRQSTSGLPGASGIVVVRYATEKTSSDWIGFTRFNTTYGIRELWNGENWVNADNGLTVGLGLTEFAPAPSAKYVKTATPSAATGFYWIRPPGETKAYQVYCDMDTMGGGWMLLWYNNGGPQTSGNDAMYSILNGAEDDNARPFLYGGTKGHGKARHSEFWMNYVGGEIMKTYGAWNSSNTRLNGDTGGDSGLGNGAGGGANGNLIYGRTNRVVADRLDMGERVTYRDVVGTTIGTNSSYDSITLNNRVTLYLDNGSVPGSRNYGQTNTVLSSTGNRGFANYLDPQGTEPYMLHWAARHWISYSSNSSGSNANRCQYVCYGGEDLWIENSWFYREKGIAQ